MEVIWLHCVRILGVLRLLFEGAHAGVAVQAFAVVESGVEPDVCGFWDRADVLHINVAQPAEFGVEGAEHGVVGMAGVAGVIAGDKIVLEMRRRNVTGIVHVEASAKVVHDVAGETELCAGGTLHVFGIAKANRYYRQNEERHEGQNFAAASPR